MEDVAAVFVVVFLFIAMLGMVVFLRNMARYATSKNKSYMRQSLLWLALSIGILVFVKKLAPPLVESLIGGKYEENGVYEDQQVLNAAKSIPSIDLHTDSLLWTYRDFVNPDHSNGHADLPRLVAGHNLFTVLGVVTGVPFGLNFEYNEDRLDVLSLVSLLQGWPMRTWFSRYERAIFASETAHKWAAASQLTPKGDTVILLKTRSDLLAMLSQRYDLSSLGISKHHEELFHNLLKNPESLEELVQIKSNLIGVMLSLEGMHCLDNADTQIKGLYQAGFRQLGLAHFVDNIFAGSAHGAEKGGISDLGKKALKTMNELGMVLDLAHASPQSMDEALQYFSGPVLSSHTGVQGICDSPRNLSDAQLQMIAQRGGLIGIGYFKGATCGEGVSEIADSILYAVRKVGVENVALGSDFDGAVKTPIDSSEIWKVLYELLQRGMSREDIVKISYGNALRFYLNALPESLPVG